MNGGEWFPTTTRKENAMLSNSEFFKAAHKVARETRANFETYRMAFSAALKGLYAMEKSQKENRWEATFEAAFEAAEKDADLLHIEEGARANYVSSNVRSRLNIVTHFDLAKVKDRMTWDPEMTKDTAIYSVMMVKRLESMLEGKSRENASPRVTARFNALDEMKAFLNEMCA